MSDVKATRTGGEGKGNTAGRIRSLSLVGGRDVYRDPVLLGLLLVIPAYFVGVWGTIVPDDDLSIDIATADGTETVTVTFPELMTALIAPVTGALLIGVTGLFLVQRSRDVDRRLTVTGFRLSELLAARFAILTGITAFVVAVVTAVAHLHLDPEHLGWFVLGLALAAGIYGAVGTVVGLLVGRMAGVYILLFVPMIDVVLLQSPMADTDDWVTWLPGHHATELVLSAAFAGDVATGHALFGVLALGVAGTLATLVNVARRLK